MNILMLGDGKGSFEVRGKQLGAVLGARVRTAPTRDDLAWATVVVLIKRAGLTWADTVHRVGKPIVWDALDFWDQPEQNALSEAEAIRLFEQSVARIGPALTIGATHAMAAACGGAYIPHHARPTLTPRPVRKTVKFVAYEGTKKYLGTWASLIQRECVRRGWRFVINPPDLSEADIIVAFRDGQWDGWMCREWKSGVKIVNAMSTGRPILTQQSAAFDEIKPFGSLVNAPEDLSESFDEWMMFEDRDYVSRRDFSLSRVAADYRAILERVA